MSWGRAGHREEVEELLREFKDSLLKLLGKNFSSMVLFGSYARAEADEESDVDIAILTRRRLTREEKKEVSKIASRLSLKYDLVISCVFYPEEEFRRRQTPFLSNIRKEGIKV